MTSVLEQQIKEKTEVLVDQPMVAVVVVHLLLVVLLKRQVHTMLEMEEMV